MLSEDVDMVVMGILSEEADVVVVGVCFEDAEEVVMGVLSEEVEVVVVGVSFEDVELILVDELLTMLVLTTIVELTYDEGQSGTSGGQLVTVCHSVLVMVEVISPYCPFAALVSRATDRADKAHDGFASSMTI